MKRPGGAASLGLVLFLCACAQPSHRSVDATRYAVGARLSVGGTGRWDLLAVDSARHHLFLTRSDRVDVVDTRDGRPVASIFGIDGAHGIAIAPDLRRGFATAGHADTVTEFDLASLTRVRDIKVGGHAPDAIAYDAGTHRVFVFNAHSNNASVIDARGGSEIATIAFAGNPELGTSDGRGHVFVNIEDKAELVEIDAARMQVLRTWPLTGCTEPTGLAMDAAHARLFSACQNRVMVVTDARNGRQVARVPIGAGPDGAVFDAKRQLAFIPAGRDGTLGIVHEDDPDHFRVAQTLVTQAGARTIALDSASHRLYLPAARFETQVAGSSARPPMIEGSFSVLEVRSVSVR